MKETLNYHFNQLIEANENEKDSFRKDIIKIMNQYIEENEFLTSRICSILKEQSTSTLHAILHLAIETFFSKGYKRWIATGISSFITFFFSFILEMKFTKDWKRSSVKSIPWAITIWSRSGIGYGFKCAIKECPKIWEKSVIKAFHAASIAISPFLTKLFISLLEYAYIKHKKD